MAETLKTNLLKVYKLAQLNVFNNRQILTFVRKNRQKFCQFKHKKPKPPILSLLYAYRNLLFFTKSNGRKCLFLEVLAERLKR